MTDSLARPFRPCAGSGVRTPLGLLPDGTPVFALSGAAPDGDGDDTGDDSGDGDGDGDGDSGDGSDGDGDGGDDGDGKLSDAGKRALDAEREKVRKARAQLSPWKAIGREFGLTPEQVRERLSGKKPDGKDGDQVDAAQVRREVEREVTEKANRRIVKAEVKALAADTFADPDDAVRLLDLDDIEVDEDGEVDSDDVRAQLDALLARKPHLGKPAADGKGKPTPKADRSQGSTSRDKATGKHAKGKGSLEAGREMYRTMTGKTPQKTS